MVGGPVPLTAYQKQLVGLGPELGLYYPLDSVYGGGDLTSPPQRNAEALGGITLGGLSPGPIARDGRSATTFDGSNDQLATNWQTRTNLITNPSFEVDLTDWTKDTTNATLESWGRFGIVGGWSGDGSDFTLFVKATATANGAFVRSWSKASGGAGGFPVTAGQKYTVSAMVNILGAMPAKAPKFYIRWLNAANEVISDTSGGAAQKLGVNELSYTATAPALATSCHVMFGHYNQGNTLELGETTEHAIDAVLFEQAEARGVYFPTVLQLELGEAGWTGTEGKSTSQLGPLANGTTRSTCAWLNPAGFATRGLWGRSNLDGLWLTAGGALRFRTNGVDETWTATVANGTWRFLMHVFDERNGTSSIYINGALVETKANANVYSTSASGGFVVGQTLGSFYNGGMAHFALMYGDQGAMARSLWRAGSGL